MPTGKVHFEPAYFEHLVVRTIACLREKRVKELVRDEIQAAKHEMVANGQPARNPSCGNGVIYNL